MKKQNLFWKFSTLFLLTYLLLNCFGCANALFPKNAMKQSLTNLQAYSQERSEVARIYVAFLLDHFSGGSAEDSLIRPLDRARTKALLAPIQGKYIVSENIKNFDEVQGRVSFLITQNLNHFGSDFTRRYYPRQYEFERHFQALNAKIQVEKSTYNHFAEKYNRKQGSSVYCILTKI